MHKANLIKTSWLSLCLFALVACGGGEADGSKDDNPADLPTLTFVAAPSTVDAGGSTTLTWSSTHASACTASGDWRGTKAASGSEARANLSGNQLYTMVCTGSAGSVTRVVQVVVTPQSSVGSIDGLAIGFERATPEQIGIYAPVTRTLAAGSTVAVRYRRAGESAWQVAQPLLRVHPEWTDSGAPVRPVDSFAGTIFDLLPGASYQVEMTLTEPGRPPQTFTTTTSTRALPPPAPPVTVRATPADTLQAVVRSLQPGDVLELANGTYHLTNRVQLERAGTADKPIYIRGQSRQGVILKGNWVFQIVSASHLVLENLTIEGPSPGVDGSATGIRFWDGHVQEYITLRDLDMRGMDLGIVSTGPSKSTLVYNNVLRGNNPWSEAFLHSNVTWNDDGISLGGEGNAAFENTLDGFGDAFSGASGVHSAGVYFYRNRVLKTGDDAFEADYMTRNIGFYDNYLTNAAIFLSLDPLYGGPLYCFRNVMLNTFRGPFKFNAPNSGMLIYNNTIVRTEGLLGWGWVQFRNGPQRSWAYRNNVLIYRGNTGKLLAMEAPGHNLIDFTHNAWFGDGEIAWAGGGTDISEGGFFVSLAEAQQRIPDSMPLFGTSTRRHDHDFLTVSDPFATPVTLGPDHLTEYTSEVVPSLAPGVNAKHAGVLLPNITDGFTGTNPDVGAIIEGRPVPHWGATR